MGILYPLHLGDSFLEICTEVKWYQSKYTLGLAKHKIKKKKEKKKGGGGGDGNRLACKFEQKHSQAHLTTLINNMERFYNVLHSIWIP